MTTTKTELIVVGRPGFNVTTLDAGHRPQHAVFVSTSHAVHTALASSMAPEIWILSQGMTTTLVSGVVEARASLERARRRLLLLEEQSERSALVSILLTTFDVVVAWQRSTFLPLEELSDVMLAPNAAELFIGGRYEPQSKTMILYRGNLVPVVVPVSVFRQVEGGPTPQPDRMTIDDSGQTVKLGEYEASSAAILSEVDPEYRRSQKARRRAEESGFGASLRRLRVQRGLRQSDFPGLSEKEVGRIERGTVGKPHVETIEKLAAQLRVRPNEIEEY